MSLSNPVLSFWLYW